MASATKSAAASTRILTTNKHLIRWVEKMAELTQPEAVHWIDGSDAENEYLCQKLVDAGTFDWTASDKFPEFTEADPSYHGVKYVESFGNLAYIIKARVQLLRDIGASISPFNSWLLLQGLETLGLRVERHCSNAQKVAEFLRDHPRVVWVSYPGLPGHASYDRAQKYLPKGSGAILTFGIKGGGSEARAFIDRLKLFSLLANVGDAKSLVIHPASTTHQQLTIEEQITSGVSEDTIRLSIGIEDVADIIADLRAALEHA